MQKKVVLFASGYLGAKTLYFLEEAGVFPDVVSMSENVSRRKTWNGIFSRSDKFNIYEFSSDFPSLRDFLNKYDFAVAIDWTKDFFHNLNTSADIFHVHASLLPFYRGYGAVSAQFLRGVAVSGVSIYIDNGRIDAGDILYQKEFNVALEDTPEIFLSNCASHASDFIAKLSGGTKFAKKKQNEDLAFYVVRNRPSANLIDFNASAFSAYNFMRAYFYPYPNASFFYDGAEYKVAKASLEKWSGKYGKSGEIIKLDANGAEVACGEGSVILQELSGEVRFSVGDVLNR